MSIVTDAHKTVIGRTKGKTFRLVWIDAAYGPKFDDVSHAACFIKFVGDKTGLDPHHQSPSSLERLREEWSKR